MNGNRVFIGTIKECCYFSLDNNSSYCAKVIFDLVTKKECILPDEIIKENAILIKFGENYIDIDDIKGNIDIIQKILKKCSLKTKPKGCGWRYIDEKTLKPYYLEKTNTSITKLKRSKIKNNKI